MKTEEYKQIIYESFTYPDYAITDFFRKKQRESGFSNGVFYIGLATALIDIAKYLDSNSGDIALSWRIKKSDIGKKEPTLEKTEDIKNTINLMHVTNGRIQGMIWSSEDLAPVARAIQELKRLTEQEGKSVESGPMKSEKLEECFSKYGFFDLPLVKELPHENQRNLVQIIGDNVLPYRIAMIDFLGFIMLLDKEYFRTNRSRDKEISKWFDSDKDGRAVRGYITSLVKEPRTGRYKAHLYKIQVQKDYEALKKGVPPY